MRQASRLHRFASGASFALLALVTGCDPEGYRHSGAQSATAPSESPAPYIGMTEVDIRGSAMGCLQAPPYLDGGPTCLRRDGSWVIYGGWGKGGGRFHISGNQVVMEYLPSSQVSDPPRIAFFRDRRGAMFIRYGRPHEDHRLQAFTPYPEEEYLRASAL